jgi:predicted Zn-dependent protease
MMNQDQAKKVIEKILALSKADAVRININDDSSSNLRFARNTVTTSGSGHDTSLSIIATFGKRTGSYSVNQFDEETLAGAVRKAEELARLAPEDPEYMPPLEAQSYPPSQAFAEATANVPAEYRAGIAGECIAMASEKKLVSAGFVEDSDEGVFFGNSKGLFAAHRRTGISYSVTARTSDGTGSGWGGGGHTDRAKLDAAAISRRAIEKAQMSVNPQTIPPGKYTVVLEPEAVSNLLGNIGFRIDARSADEGRSFFSDAGGRNRIGQQIFPPFVNISSDPSNPEAPGLPWSEDGMPSRKISWIEGGVLRNLRYSRYWGLKQGKEPTPGPANLIMEGGSGSLEDLIAATEAGVLVTRFWYIRDVDPKTILLTGLTRDGTFWIEKGKIAYPIKNFRFNESPVAMLKNIEMMSKQYRMQGGGSANLIPALKVKDFTFSSLSDAV